MNPFFIIDRNLFHKRTNGWTYKTQNSIRLIFVTAVDYSITFIVIVMPDYFPEILL